MKINNSKPLISIIVPVFQVEKYLDKCISSIINQSYHNLEIILVDDGSTDNCPAICDKYRAVDNRIKVIHKKNGGLSQARNVGLEIATGDFIGFVDSDDWIEPNMYEVLISTLEELNADIVACAYQYESEDSKSILKGAKTFENRIYSPEEALRNIFNGKSFISIMVWNKLYRRTIVNNIIFSEGKIYEDYLWTPMVINKSKTIACIDYPLYHYINRQESLSHNLQQTPRRLHDKIEMCEKRLEFIRKNYPKLVKIAILHMQDFCCIAYVRICFIYGKVDTNKEIRYELNQHFRRYGLQRICHLGNIKMTFAKILFWINPNLSVKAYKIYKISKEYLFIRKRFSLNNL